MDKKLKVLIVASEVTPYAKSGGLGDVIGSLPFALKEENVDVRVVFPKYKSVKKESIKDLHYKGSTPIKLGWRNQNASIHEGFDQIPIYLVENDYYFNRDGFYGYGDDFERFAFFTKAALELLPIVDFKPDIINFNDWQCGLGPIFLKDQYSRFTFYSNIKSVFTIHNIQYQGIFGKEILENVGLNYGYMVDDKLECFGNVNFMKGGIIYADAVSTVSKTYAKEIQTPQYGYSLDGLLSRFNYKVHGILNGIDVNLNNPKTDTKIYKNFDVLSLEEKKYNKKLLQEELGLPQNESTPVISIISRLVDQKGLNLIADAMEHLMSYDIQLVVLGTGDGRYEDMFHYMKHAYPTKVSTNIYFNEELAHKIYASSDLFLMPSLFEPCGLGQIFAMRYATVPIVRNTGGLSDTVTHFNKTTKKGNGFVFNDFNKEGMMWAIDEALACYHSEDFAHVVKNAITSDFSWKSSAGEYLKMYKSILVNND